MGNGSKKLYWAGAGAAFLFVLLVAITVIVPRVIDTVWLKEIIQTEIAKQINGDFGFQKVELVLLPTPSISLKQIDLAIPETVKANLEVLRVYPKLLPLFSGNIELNRVIIDTPDFSLPLPERQKKTDPEKTFSFDKVLENSFSETAQILAAIQGLEVDVRNGTLRLFADAEPVFLFEDINGEYAFGTKSLTITVSSKSNI